MGAMKRFTSSLIFVVTTAAAAVIACGETDYTAGVYDKRYGPPEALRAVDPPSAYNNSFDGGDAAAAGNPATICDGGGPIDGGPCAVSFKTTLMPLFITNCGSASCHSAATGVKPKMDPANPDVTWANFVAQQPITGKRYINPCSTDKTASSIVCNMAATPCGTGMPLPAPGSFAAQPIATQTDIWLACGSPNN